MWATPSPQLPLAPVLLVSKYSQGTGSLWTGSASGLDWYGKVQTLRGFGGIGMSKNVFAGKDLDAARESELDAVERDLSRAFSPLAGVADYPGALPQARVARAFGPQPRTR